MPIIFDMSLINLDNNLTKHLKMSNIRPSNVKYLGTIDHCKDTNLFKFTWGWLEEDYKKGEFSLEDLQHIKYINNLEIILNSKNTITMQRPPIFACLECIRNHHGKDTYIYMIDTQKENMKYIYL